MSGNTLGRQFTLTTFGESHGVALGGVVDGCPPGMALSVADLQVDLDRRKPGQSKYTTQRKESDRVEILSGVFEGVTTGTPIGLLIHNEGQRTRDYEKIKDRFRPGHADYTYLKKYGLRDYRGGGRSSARETTMRVAAGGIARKYLAEHYGVTIRGCVYQIGDIYIERKDWDEVAANPFFVGDKSTVEQLGAFIDQIRREGDSVGAAVYVEACGVPVGWGEPVFDRLDADIAKAMMSINAAKGVEIGAGFESVMQRGSQHRDQMNPKAPQLFMSNRAGGVLGGHFQRAEHRSQGGLQADLQHRGTGANREPRQPTRRCGGHRQTRPVRRHPRRAHRRSHACVGADGSRVARPRADSEIAG